MVEYYEGGGPFSAIREAYTRFRTAIKGRPGYSPQVREILEKYGNNEVREIKIYRIPIASAIDRLGNLLSQNKLNEAKKASNYDNLFHLFATIRLDNNILLKAEKNQQIDVEQTSPEASTDYKQVNPENITLSNLFQKGENTQGTRNWFDYDAFTNNCQKFIYNLLKGSNLLTPDITNFVLQDISQVARAIPAVVRRLATAITTAANRAHILLKGASKHMCKCCCKTLMGGHYQRHLNSRQHQRKILCL